MQEVRSKFYNAQNAIAMHYYINNWLSAVEQINLENTIHNIIASDQEDEDGEDEDGPASK